MKDNRLVHFQVKQSHACQFFRRAGTILCCLVMMHVVHAQSPPTITTNPASQIVFVGSNVLFRAAATGAQTYQWQKNNTNIPSQTGVTLYLPKVTTNESGSYRVTASNAQGSVTSSAAGLTVLESRLWAMGDNSSGQLGDGTLNLEVRPISTLGGAKQVAAGSSHSLFIKPDGSLWAMGNNGCGQLGNGTTTQQITPVPVAAEATSLAVAANQSFYITADKSLWAIGYNGSGQLGDGTTFQRNTPERVATNVTSVAPGVNHTLFITADGSLWAMGDNSNGQLGDGTIITRSTPVKVATNVMAAAAGASHSLFIQTDGSLWAMGNNSSGQLGDATTVQHSTPEKVAINAVAASCGAYHSVYVRTDGTLWAMGDNSCGQLGDGSTVQKRSPVQVANNVTTNAGGVAAGFFHTLFINNQGALWAMGANSYGQLGDRTTDDQSSPVYVASSVKRVSAGGNHTLFTANWLQPFVIEEQPLSQTTSEGQDIQFQVRVPKEPELSYRWQWRKNGANISGANAPTLRLANVQEEDAAAYSVVISMNDISTLASSEARLVVIPYGAPTVWADHQEVVGHATKSGPSFIFLQSAFENAYIFYTLDGSVPTFTSEMYHAPFIVSNTVVIRAIAITPDFSNVAEAPPTTVEVLPFTVTATTLGGGSVTVTPPQEYYAGNSHVSITATPDPGWQFMGWQGDASGTNNLLNLVVNHSKTIRAIFGTALRTNVVGNGRIQILPYGLTPYGTLVQLTAVPAPGNVFVVWGNEVSGWSNPRYFEVTSATPLIGALFTSPPTGETVVTQNPDSVSAPEGSALVLQVRAIGGALTYQWRFNGAPILNATNTTLSITSLNTEQSGAYDVVVSGPQGSAISAAAHVAMTAFALRPVISVHGSPGMAFHVDYTEDVASGSWTLLKAGTLEGSRTDVIDQDATNRQKRFYRVVIDN